MPVSRFETTTTTEAEIQLPIPSTPFHHHKSISTNPALSTTNLLLQRCPHVLDTSGPDELWQLKRRFLYATLALQVFTLVAPVTRDWNCVASCLHVSEEERETRVLNCKYSQQ